MGDTPSDTPTFAADDVSAMIDAIEAYADGDRDLQKRRALAEQHAARAERLAEGAALDRRAAAMREAGRALALDPGSTPALRGPQAAGEQRERAGAIVAG